MELVVTTAALRRSKLQSKCYHHQTNTQFFLKLTVNINDTSSTISGGGGGGGGGGGSSHSSLPF